METPMTTTIHATVLRVKRCELCICDHETDQEILVHTQKACCFRPGDHVCVHYCGAMTRSIPPQITATCVEKIRSCGC